jgi:hypothetical protein
VQQHVNIANLEEDITGCHWDGIRELLPLYRAITTVQLGDGNNIFSLLWWTISPSGGMQYGSIFGKGT